MKKPAAKKSTAKPRAKKAAPKTAKVEPASDEDVAINGEDEDEAPKTPAARRGKATPKKMTPKRKVKSTAEENEEADVEEVASAPVPAAAPDDDSELSELEDEPPKKPVKRARATSNASPKKPTPKRPRAKPTVKEESDIEEVAPPPPAAAAAVDSDSELSDVDEPPMKKKPRKRSLDASAKTTSPNKKAKVTPKVLPKDEIKEETIEEPKEQTGRLSAPVADDAGSDSDMSVVLDPTPKKGRSSIIGKVSAPKKTKSPKAPAGRKSKAKKADVSYARCLLETMSLTPK